jgi:hypothetical protein
MTYQHVSQHVSQHVLTAGSDQKGQKREINRKREREREGGRERRGLCADSVARPLSAL